MKIITDVKAGSTLRIDNKLYRVLEAIKHAGTGQMTGFVELKMKDLESGHTVDKRFKFLDKVEEVDVAKRHMEYIYTTGNEYFFMDPESFVQVPLSKGQVGNVENFLKEGLKVTIELLDDLPIAVYFPKIMELIVSSTGPGIKQAQDNTMKPATLENGVEILVPQFIETGDLVRVDTEKIKYIDRVQTKKI